MRKFTENQVKGIAALLKFGNYSMSHVPPVIWRETTSFDYGFDGELEFTQKDQNGNIIPTGKIVRVVAKATSRFHSNQLSIQIPMKDFEFYKEYLLDVLLVVYDVEHDRLFAKKLADISFSKGKLSQQINFHETDELKVGDNKLFSLLSISETEIPSSEKSLLSKLSACASGRDSWKSYEEICISIIDFLFQDSFRNYHRIVQPRNDNGLDIKDLVIPNRSNEPFWNEVRMDYQARNIVFEFKNYDDPIGKGQLIQISNYLKKRAYGRFGIIFCRKGLSKNGFEEQKELLRDDDKMIIVLSDEDVIELVKQKNMGQHPETILERMKTELELNI